MTRHSRSTAILGTATLVAALFVPTAWAQVSTDQADYAPGSTVTISGDNSNGTNYAPGETVTVNVDGPNAYTAGCTGTVLDLGNWSCQVTLWSTLDAVGSYTYTAKGAQSGTAETGTFTDDVTVVPVSLQVSVTGLPTGTLALPITVTYKAISGSNTTTTETVTAASPLLFAVKKNGDLSYSGYVDSVVVGSYVCTRSASTTESGTVPSVTGTSTIIVTRAYTCAEPPPADTTPPVITPHLVGTQGDNGWYTSAVQVSWTITDPESTPSIVTGCVDQTISTDTASITLSCTAHSAGGTSSSSATFKLDQTPPSASLGVTAGTPGNGGWYTSAVTVHTSGTDATSGIASCDNDQIFTADTSGTLVDGSCTDQAGNVGSAIALNLKIDQTGPSAVLAVTAGHLGDNDWYTTDATISTSGSDGLGGAVICTDPQYLTTDSPGTVFNGSCTDAAGNTTAATPLTVKLDETNPVVTVKATGTQGLDDWYTGDVTITTIGTDVGGSGIALCDSVETLTADTTGQTFTKTCTDNAGNIGTGSVTVKRDATPPAVTVAVSAGTSGAHGWYTSDVTVHTSGIDSISGISSCTADQSQESETTGEVFTGSCTNGAGLGDTKTLTVKLDKTGPSAVLSVTAGTPGAHGWYTSDVTVHAAGTDSISSPVTCTDDQFQTAETAGQVFNGSCTNDAGLKTDAAPMTVMLDKTAPADVALAVTAGTAGAHGWYTADVTVSTSGTDAISGPTSCTDDQFQTSETIGTLFSGTCTNQAGLSDTKTLTVKLDKTGPTAVESVTAGTLGSHGWYTSDVTIATIGADVVSGIDTCTADQSQTVETAGADFTGSCTNMAGLSTTSDVLQVKLDKTAPAITWSSALPADGGSYYWGDIPTTETCTAVDLVSLVAPPGCGVTGYSTDTGTHIAVASATNYAGLTTTETRTYSVMPWTLRGFYTPVDMGFVWNVVKAGSTVPLKFNVFKGETELTSPGDIVAGPKSFAVEFNPTGGPSKTALDTATATATTTGKTQLRYDSTAGQFIQNWQTPKAPGYYKVTLTTRDGSTLIAWFYLK